LELDLVALSDPQEQSAHELCEALSMGYIIDFDFS
jgi:hypothetical protein